MPMQDSLHGKYKQYYCLAKLAYKNHLNTDCARGRYPTSKLGRREQVGGGSRGEGVTLKLSVGEGS